MFVLLGTAQFNDSATASAWRPQHTLPQRRGRPGAARHHALDQVLEFNQFIESNLTDGLEYVDCLPTSSSCVSQAEHSPPRPWNAAGRHTTVASDQPSRPYMQETQRYRAVRLETLFSLSHSSNGRVI